MVGYFPRCTLNSVVARWCVALSQFVIKPGSKRAESRNVRNLNEIQYNAMYVEVCLLDCVTVCGSSRYSKNRDGISCFTLALMVISISLQCAPLVNMGLTVRASATVSMLLLVI